MTDAAGHLSRAQSAADAARPDLVHQHVRAGLAVVADEVLELRLRLTDVLWTAERHGHERAEAELAGLEARARALGHAELVALTRAQSASMLLRAGRLGEARALLASLDDTVLGDLDRVRVLLNRGTLSAHLEPGTGEADLWRAYEVADGADLRESAFRALHNLGWLAFLRGDLPEALALMRRADAVEVEVDRTVAQLDRARVLLEAGLVRDARASLEAARAGALASGQAHAAGEVDLELARTHLLLGDPAAAADAYARSRGAFADLGATAWADRAALAELALAVGDGGPSDAGPDRQTSTDRRTDTDRQSGPDRQTVERMRRLAASTRAHGDVTATVDGTLALAELALRTGDPDAARAELGALAPGESSRSPYLTTRLRVLALRVRLALAADDRAAAGRLLARASRELAAARSRPASLDLRTAMAVHARQLADLDLDLGVRTGRARSVLARSERWRTASHRLPPVRDDVPAEEAALLRDLRAVHADLAGAPPGVDTAPLLARARGLERQVREVDWTAAGPSGAAGGEPSRPVTTPALAAALAASGHALVSYAPHGPRMLAVVVTPGGPARLLDLGPTGRLRDLVLRVRADVHALATTRVPGPLLAVVRGSLAASLDDLAAALVAPVLAGVPADAPLVLVPALDLGNVPWGMLPGTRGRPVTVSRSASAWARGSAGSTGSPGSTGSTGSAGRGRGVAAVAGPGLPTADEEARAVAAAWRAAGSETRVVAAAHSTPDLLADALATHPVVHVAAHGLHDQESPLFSSIRTAAGPAFAHELARRRLAARHVVLAACEGGRATLRPGDEPLGLTATLLELGVTSVVAPTSVVPDEDAHAFVLAHHRELAAGADAATAVARATVGSPLLAGSFTAFGGAWRATGPAYRN